MPAGSVDAYLQRTGPRGPWSLAGGASGM